MAVFLTSREIEIRHFHLFCGLGGGAKGFNAGEARIGHAHAKFRCVGGVDVDKAAIADFTRLAGVRGTVLDLFSREQYIAFHGCEPPADWREATPDDIRHAAGNEIPHIGFGSAPCKGFSGLLSEARSGSSKYQALNQLALRGLWMALEAWKDSPLPFWLWENVPRIATRGRNVLDQMIRLLEAYGYVVAETTHDCGELGELAQSRKRFLLVARHREQVPPFLYEPPKRPLRSVGDVLGAFPLPSDPGAGPMHRMRELQWKTWVRLAFVKAGSDWRSLKDLRVENGVLKDFAIVPQRAWHNGAMGVTPWDESTGTVTGSARPHNGGFNVADPRIDGHPRSVQFGVKGWDESSTTVTGAMWPGCGPTSVADPRPENWEWSEGRRGLGVLPWEGQAGTVTSQAGANQGANSVADPRLESGRNDRLGVRAWDDHAHVVAGDSLPSNGAHAIADPRYQKFGEHYGKMRVESYEEPAHTITGSDRVGSGALSVADPRLPNGERPRFSNVFKIVRWDEISQAVVGQGGAGGQAVADPRTGIDRGKGDDYLTARHYGVLPWGATAQAVTASASHDNGMWSVADHRGLPHPEARTVAVIRALDGTWHRPFTTLELAALQSLVEPGEYFELQGASDTAWRERIGNAVPAKAAQAIASVMGQTLLLAWSGETFQLNAMPIWVRPLVIALAVDAPVAPS